MEVNVSHHVDEGGGFRYEYDLYEFVFGTRVARARRYVEESPESIAVLGMIDMAAPAPPLSLYDIPEAQQIVSELRQRGFEHIEVLGPGGYAALDQARLDKKQ